MALKLWLVVGGDDKIMADHWWSCVVAAKLWLIVDGCGKLWMFVGGGTK